MRVLLLLRGDVPEILQELLDAMGHRVAVADPDSVVAVSDVEDVLNREIDWVCLPLTLPNYNSLRLAELIHRRKAPLRTFLLTASSADRPARGRLFDIDEHPPAPLEAFQRLDSIGARSWRSSDEVRDSIARILRTALCFNIGHGGGRHPEYDRPSELRDYDLAARFSKVDYLSAISNDFDARQFATKVRWNQGDDLVATRQLEILAKLNELLERTQSPETVRLIEARERQAEVDQFLSSIRTWEQKAIDLSASVAVEAAVKATGADAFGLGADAIGKLLQVIRGMQDS